MIRGSLISLAGISFIGMPVFLSYSTEKNVPTPKLVLTSKEKSGTSLSFDYNSFLKNGKMEENRQVPFKDSKLKFGDYQLKEGDILCSPAQDGTYLVLRKRNGRNTGYEIKGNSQVWHTCPHRDFLKLNPNVETIQFKGFPLPNSINLYSSTVFISSCFFELQKSKTNSKFEILWDKCRSTEFNGTVFRNVKMTMDD